MHTDDFTELEVDAVSDGMKVYFKDIQGEYKELSLREVDLTPIMKCTTERIFEKSDYAAERRYWIKRIKKNGVLRKK